MPQINELTTRTFDGDSLIGFDVENADPQTQAEYPYVTGKADGNAVANFIANEQEYVTNLDTVNKHINGAINELHAINGYNYDAYDDTATYSVGDLCIYNNVLYKAKQATTGNLPTNTTYWEETSIADEISELNTGKVDLTPIELTFNSHSNITIFRNQSFKIGKLVILSCVLKVEGNIANGDNILTSLPTMAKMSNYQGRLRFPKIIGNDEYYGSPTEGLNISDNTTVLTNFGAITATPTNPKYIFININYVTSD